MSVKLRLTVMSFLQFFVWGAWLITIANYWFDTRHWEGTEFGLVFATMGFASLFMPTLAGIVADRWVNAERVYAALHLLYALMMMLLPEVQEPRIFILTMFVAMCSYMPTIALSNSISYSVLKGHGRDVIRDFPPIRVWGTVGFIAAMWLTNLTGYKASVNQFYLAGLSALGLALYALTLPACPPQRPSAQRPSLGESLGLNAFRLFADYKMALFFLFSMCLGAALQLTNAYGDVFLSEFKYYPQYADSVVVKRSTLIMSISQISETLCILAIPFFLKRFGIKKVMLMSMLAWVARFGLFGLGNPEDRLWMIILSCIVYGMAFDFFNISGSLFVESSTDPKMRSSAQGLFMMMTNGFGAMLGSIISGWAIQNFFTRSYSTLSDLADRLLADPRDSRLLAFVLEHGSSVSESGQLTPPILVKDWPQIWLAFAAYALIVAIAFALLFHHKHRPEEVPSVSH